MLCFCANVQATELRATARPAQDQSEQLTLKQPFWIQAHLWACVMPGEGNSVFGTLQCVVNKPGHISDKAAAVSPFAVHMCKAFQKPLDVKCLPPPCSLLAAAGIDCAPTTVKVCRDQLRIDLHSPLPDGAVSDMGAALNARGTLKREPQGVIRTLEIAQLHLVYA